MNYIQTLKTRKSVYSLHPQIPIAIEQLQQDLQTILEETPAAFNRPDQAMALLTGDHHQAMWDAIYQKILPLSLQPERTKAKIDAIKNTFGTILFFANLGVIDHLQQEFPLYQEKFELWSHQQAGMLQINVWNYLAEQQIGASLQHYCEIIQEWVLEHFHLPAHFQLIAQMPFGGMEEGIPAKKKPDSEGRFFVFE